MSSLPQAYSDPLRGPLADFWRGRLAPLGHRARILDLGCGNGAVALLAAATGAARGAHWEVHGVDAASIDPRRDLAGRYREDAATVTFHPRTAMTDTPFSAGHFDLVAGQFALEYGDPPRVLDEVRRLLRRGGRAAFVLHLRESEVVATGAVELAQLRATRALFAAAGRVLAVSAAAAPAWAQLSAWNGFGRELLRLERLAEAHPERWPVATLREVPATVRDLVSAAVSEPGATIGPRAAQRCRRSLADFSGLLATHAERLAELLAAAPDRVAVDRLLRCAARRDLQLIERTDLRDRARLIDRAGRPASPAPLLAHAIILRRMPVARATGIPVAAHVLGWRMRSNRLGRSSLQVSEVGLGCMSLAKAGAAAERIVGRALDLGVNFFDTADLYDHGANEELLGRALGARRRDVVIATKVGNRWRADGSGWDWDPSPAYVRAAVEASLKRLASDYVDLYQLHGGTIQDPIDELIATFDALVQAGKVRAWGISSIRPNVIRRYAAGSAIASVMMQYSLLDRRPEEAVLDLLRRRGIAVIARGPVAKGLLAGRPARAVPDHDEERVAGLQAILKQASAAAGRAPAQTALRFALSAPAVATVIPGASTLAQLEQNVATIATPPLDAAELGALRAAAPAARYQLHR